MKVVLAVAICSTLALAAGSSLAAQAVPTTVDNILTEMKQAESGDGDVIYVENRSTQNIVVTSLKFSECENIKPGCHIVPLKVRVKAGDKRMIYRVLPRNPDQGFGFRYTFAWTLEDEGVPSGPVPVGDRARTPPVQLPFAEVSRLIDAAEFRPAVAAVDSGGACLRTDDPSALLMSFGPVETPIRFIMIQLDSARRPIYFSDIRGDVGPDRHGLRTTIAINLVQQIGSLSNEGGERLAERYSARGPGLLTAPNLGPPKRVIEQVVNACGGPAS